MEYFGTFERLFSLDSLLEKLRVLLGIRIGVKLGFCCLRISVVLGLIWWIVLIQSFKDAWIEEALRKS